MERDMGLAEPEGNVPARPHSEFVVEGELDIVMNNGCPMFFIGDSHLSELVGHHFDLKRDNVGKRSAGRVQVIISRIAE